MAVETLTDEHVLEAMDPNGATMKYGEIVGEIAVRLDLSGVDVYRTCDRRLQSMRRAGLVELIKGPGGGWRLSTGTVRTRKRFDQTFNP